MKYDKRPNNSSSLVIDYRDLGTISVTEMMHAVIEDAHILTDVYNINFVKGSRLKVFATDEYGQPVRIINPAGGAIQYMPTHHLRPACKDYEL